MYENLVYDARLNNNNNISVVFLFNVLLFHSVNIGQGDGNKSMAASPHFLYTLRKRIEQNPVSNTIASYLTSLSCFIFFNTRKTNNECYDGVLANSLLWLKTFHSVVFIALIRKIEMMLCAF